MISINPISCWESALTFPISNIPLADVIDAAPWPRRPRARRSRRQRRRRKQHGRSVAWSVAPSVSQSVSYSLTVSQPTNDLAASAYNIGPFLHTRRKNTYSLAYRESFSVSSSSSTVFFFSSFFFFETRFSELLLVLSLSLFVPCTAEALARGASSNPGDAKRSLSQKFEGFRDQFHDARTSFIHLWEFDTSLCSHFVRESVDQTICVSLFPRFFGLNIHNITVFGLDSRFAVGAELSRGRSQLFMLSPRL